MKHDISHRDDIRLSPAGERLFFDLQPAIGHSMSRITPFRKERI